MKRCIFVRTVLSVVRVLQIWNKDITAEWLSNHMKLSQVLLHHRCLFDRMKYDELLTETPRAPSRAIEPKATFPSRAVSTRGIELQVNVISELIPAVIAAREVLLCRPDGRTRAEQKRNEDGESLYHLTRIRRKFSSNSEWNAASLSAVLPRQAGSKWRGLVCSGHACKSSWWKRRGAQAAPEPYEYPAHFPASESRNCAGRSSLRVDS